MAPTVDSKYILAPGTQVRQEDSGLLFYTMRGPRLYFLSSGDLLNPSFFKGEKSLVQWVGEKENDVETRVNSIRTVLGQLAEKGVIIEC